MTRAAASVALVVLPVLAVAAPVPKASEKEQLARLWGKTEGLGEFELTGPQLTLRSAGRPAVLRGDRSNAPRTARTVTGDFEVTVTVTDAPLPNRDGRHEDSAPTTRTGLYVQGGGYEIEHHVYQVYHKFNGVVNKDPQQCVWVDAWFPGGGQGRMLKATEAGKSTHLRVTRKDKAVTVSYSFDGTEWSAPHTPREEMEFPDEVIVGVFLSHTTFQTLDARFAGFSVEKLK